MPNFRDSLRIHKLNTIRSRARIAWHKRVCAECAAKASGAAAVLPVHLAQLLARLGAGPEVDDAALAERGKTLN